MSDVMEPVQASRGGGALLTGVPDGMDAFAVGRYLHDRASQVSVDDPSPVHIHVARDDRRVEAFQAALAFFHPEQSVVSFPAWDCVPYDRISPNADICLLYTSPSPRDRQKSRMPSSA